MEAFQSCVRCYELTVPLRLGSGSQALHSQDVSFMATLSALEKSSMQPVFSEMLYAVADGDIVWDHQFDDQIMTNDAGQLVFDFKALNKLRPMKLDEMKGATLGSQSYRN